MAYYFPASELEFPGNALRVFGPPGTGKTTYLASRIASTVRTYGPDSIAAASFSTTTAKEMVSRFDQASRPADRMVGTLHSMAFRAINHPNVALDHKVLADWNEQAPEELRITPDHRRGGGDSGAAFSGDPEQARTGDELLGALDRLRARCVPVDDWPPNVRAFADRWTAWKRDVGAVDYTEMIEAAHLQSLDGDRAPGNPDYLVVDEAQDLTPLELRLALSWGRHTQRLIFGLDDDQSINGWRGGTPDPLLALHGTDVQDKVLDRSYRVPESVRAAAEQWVRRLGPRRREKVYGSRLDDAGEVVTGAAFAVPEKLSSPALVEKAVAEVEAGHEVMIVAACNYMLEPLIKNLRSEGVPFHNPYRPGEIRWNPLGTGAPGTVSTAERVRRFMLLEDQDWTGEDVQHWTDMVKLTEAKMRRGTRAAVGRLAPRDPVPFAEIAALFTDTEQGRAALAAATEPSLDWLSAVLLADKKQVAQYPIQLARQRGHAALAQKPRIVVGTVHSVKGAGADIVYLAPDVSSAAARTMSTQDGIDETIRQFYVGMTRAKKQLRVLAPAGHQHVQRVQLIPPDLEVLPT